MPITSFVLAVASVLPIIPAPAARAADPAHAPLPHVRPLDPAARELFRVGLVRSASLAKLRDELDRSDVVVYVAVDCVMPTRGALAFVNRTPPATYLLARVICTHSEEERIAALAHELRHALEVAAASPVVESAADFQRLYRSIGFEWHKDDYETRAAQVTEVTVRQELSAAAATRPRL
jgi:hypothetical protein